MFYKMDSKIKALLSDGIISEGLASFAHHLDVFDLELDTALEDAGNGLLSAGMVCYTNAKNIARELRSSPSFDRYSSFVDLMDSQLEKTSSQMTELYSNAVTKQTRGGMGVVA